MRALSLLVAVSLVLTVSVFLSPAAAQNGMDPELVWSYGRSPPVYPSPIGTGTGNWAAAYSRARALVARMINEEKQNLTFGYASTTNGCSGNSGSALRVGFPGMCLNDAGNGVRGTDMINSYASGIHIGASWNRNLAYNRAQFVGAEFKAKGVQLALGPVVGPLGRIAEGGRNWEGFSNDPYLCGRLAYETVRGMQESVLSSVKHYIGNEQETNRNPEGNFTSSSSNIDDRILHELYLWPFQDAVHAGAGNVMCLYNKLNGSYGCQNSKTLNGILKTEFGFQRFVVSDWFAQHTGTASAQAGLDMAMPDSPYWQGNLTIAVANGSLAQSRLDDMATRIVAAWYHIGADSPSYPSPGVGIPFDLLAHHALVDARIPASRINLVQQAVEGHVLVKNVHNALPLKSPKFVSLFGYDAHVPLVNNPSPGFGKWAGGFQPVNTPEESIVQIFVSPSAAFIPEAARDGTMITGGGSGANEPSYISAPYDAFQQRAWEDGAFLHWDFVSQDPSVDGGTEVCIVFINEFSNEGLDRPGLADPWSDTLVTNVANKCNNTMVVIHNAGVRLVDRWIDHPNITAVIYAHLPGQDSGRALVEIMYGGQSPSGRLPYTVARNESDYGNLQGPCRANSPVDFHPQCNFTEGLYVDYRHFIAQNITPRFESGFGLTYTTFAYASLSTALLNNATISYLPPQAPIQEGGLPSLWDIIATVDCTVTNSGSVDADEVAQLYIGIPNAPAKQLRGFGKQDLEPGQTVPMHFELTRRDLSVWDVVQQQWVLPSGTYAICVGASVLDIRLTGSLKIKTA